MTAILPLIHKGHLESEIVEISGLCGTAINVIKRGSMTVSERPPIETLIIKTHNSDNVVSAGDVHVAIVCGFLKMMPHRLHFSDNPDEQKKLAHEFGSQVKPMANQKILDDLLGEVSYDFLKNLYEFVMDEFRGGLPTPEVINNDLGRDEGEEGETAPAIQSSDPPEITDEEIKKA